MQSEQSSRGVARDVPNNHSQQLFRGPPSSPFHNPEFNGMVSNVPHNQHFTVSGPQQHFLQQQLQYQNQLQYQQQLLNQQQLQFQQQVQHQNLLQYQRQLQHQLHHQHQQLLNQHHQMQWHPFPQTDTHSHSPVYSSSSSARFGPGNPSSLTQSSFVSNNAVSGSSSSSSSSSEVRTESFEEPFVPLRRSGRHREKVEAPDYDYGSSDVVETKSSSPVPLRFCLPSNFISHIGSKPLAVIPFQLQRCYTLAYSERAKLSEELLDEMVNAPVRVMGPRKRNIKLTELYVVAKDLCQLLHVSKGNVAKRLAKFTDAEKSRMLVRGHGDGGSYSTNERQVLVLTIAGCRRLVQNSKMIDRVTVFDSLMAELMNVCIASISPEG